MIPQKGAVIIFHPFLLALFPVLCLFFANRGQVLLGELYFPVGAVLLGTAVLWFFMGLCFRSVKRSAVVTSVFLILFFSFGHVVNLGFLPPKFVLAASLLLFFGCCVMVLSAKGDLGRTTDILNKVALFLVVTQLVLAGLRGWKTEHVGTHVVEKSTNGPGVAGSSHPQTLPDIYYVVLDAYTRRDVLKDVFQFDNGEFLDHLRKKRFYVADKSSSNYPVTVLSLASSLNLDYLDTFRKKVEPELLEEHLRTHELKDNLAMRFLKSKGYTTVTFSTVPSVVIDRNADICFRPESAAGEFGSVFLRTTPIPYLEGHFPWIKKIRQGAWVGSRKAVSKLKPHRDRIRFIFDHLPAHLSAGKPVFVFAHILCPHPPFVFDRNGGLANDELEYSTSDGASLRLERMMPAEEYRKEYVEQLRYVNLLTEKLIDQILSVAGPRPLVILLQADHGSRSMGGWDELTQIDFKERMDILSAYYFSDGDYGALYDSVSPVNSLRVVFDKYFGTRYGRLPDRSIFVSGPYRRVMTDVTDRR